MQTASYSVLKKGSGLLGGRALTQTVGDVHHGMTRAALHTNHLRILRLGLQYPEHTNCEFARNHDLGRGAILLGGQPAILPGQCLVATDCSLRMNTLPCLLIRPKRRCSPLEYSAGFNPR